MSHHTTRQSAPRAPHRDLSGSGDSDSDALAAQAGDEEAFERLLRRHDRSLAGYLRRFTNNESILQDLRQETYLEVCRSLPTYRHEGPFSSWLRQIASRVGYRCWAGQAREAQAKAGYLELRRRLATASAPYEQDDADSVEALFAGLGRKDRILLEMRYVQGLKATEIAESVGWNAVRVRVRIHRIIKRLRNRNGACEEI